MTEKICDTCNFENYSSTDYPCSECEEIEGENRWGGRTHWVEKKGRLKYCLTCEKGTGMAMPMHCSLPAEELCFAYSIKGQPPSAYIPKTCREPAPKSCSDELKNDKKRLASLLKKTVLDIIKEFKK